MMGLARTARIAAAIVASALILAAAPAHARVLARAHAHARAQNGYVDLNIVKAGIIIGGSGGQGTLFYHRHRYPLNVSGAGIGTLGVASAHLRGIVHNLRSPADIAGTYGAAGAGGTFGGGAAVVQLQNDNGVVLELRGAQMGFEVSLSLGGMTIALR